MVRPVNSKRKLFNTNKEQSKENEPDQLNASNSSNFALTTGPLNHNIYQFHKSTNLIHCGDHHSEETKQEKIGNFSNSHRRCDFDDAGPTLTPSRTAMPMSERQQIALLMQMSSPSPTSKVDLTLSSPCTPHFSRGIGKRNERGETPLHLAAIKGDGEKVAQLVAQGANVNATDYAGWSALHEACNKGFIIIASLLIKAGADVNAKGLENDTPLHDACVNNHHKIVRLLLKSGAKTDALNQRGKSAREVSRSPRILSLIEQSDAGILEDLDPSEFETAFSFTNSDTALNNSYYSQYHISAMSRRTPPSSKAEEKINTPLSVSSSSSVQTNPLTTSSSNNNGGANANIRPGSPRVNMRMAGVQRTPDKSKTSVCGETEDVYEFRCSKDESKGDPKEEKGDSKCPDVSSSTSCASNIGEVKSEKRARDAEQQEDDDESKKKRRKDDNSKGTGRANNSRPSNQEKSSKIGSRSNSGNGGCNKPSISVSTSSSIASNLPVSSSSSVSSTCNVSSCTSTTTSSESQKKSPSGSAANSPKPTKSDSDNEDVKNETGAPKVPPLKIVLAPCGISEQETSCQNGKNGNNRQLPYVVNSSEDKDQSNLDAKDNSVKDDPISPSSAAVPSSTAPPNSLTSTGNSSINNIVTTITAALSSVTTLTNNSSTNSATAPCGTNVVPSMNLGNNEKSSSATRITRSQKGGTGSDDGVPPEKAAKVEMKMDEALPSVATEVIHPRKRKLHKMKGEPEPDCGMGAAEQSSSNCYEMFLKIRKQVDRRRKLLFPVQPKPPQGFKDYLMNRCSYVLANGNNSQMSISVVSAPSSLPSPIEDLFNEQEQERHKLKVQQMIEKEKLVLSVEQEILRVHGRAARALANQVLPFSVCTILKDEEVYNVITPEQEDKDRRCRYNGRLFLSWLQDVDDKWDKIKEDMVMRHHNESESLHAVQKMDWEWKQKELGLVEPSAKADIDEQHVPMVQVADFDLLLPNNAC